MSTSIQPDEDRNQQSTFAASRARQAAFLDAIEKAAADIQNVRTNYPSARRQGEAAADRLRPSPRDERRDEDLVIRRLMTRRGPEVRRMPPPPLSDGGSRLASLSRYAFAGAVACGAAFLIVLLLAESPHSSAAGSNALATASWASFFGRTSEPLRATKPVPRLVVADRNGVVNKPAALGVAIEHAPRDASILVKGLAAGTQITAGVAVGDDGWLLAARDIAGAAVVPPIDYADTMNLAVELRLADGAVADAGTLRMEWNAVADGPVRHALPPTAEPASVQMASASIQGSAGAQAPPRALDPDEIAILLKRADGFIQNRDIAAAQLVLRRAAEAGNARAALALAATYDPAALRELGVLGARADVAQARAWYERAAAFGSSEASQRLEQLAQR